MTDKYCALYLRLSDDKNGTGENVADQRKGTTALADRLGLTIAKDGVYDDNDRPASDPHRHIRPAFEQMLKDAAAGRFQVLIIRHLDRLYRHPTDLSRLLEAFKPHGVTVEQEWGGHPLDLSTPTGVLHAGIVAQVSLYEIEHKRERQRARNEALLREGRPLPGGPRPFGFNKDMTHREDEAELIRQATKSLISGASLASVIRDWNSRGVPASRGGLWTYSNTRTLLLRWSNGGIRQATVTDPATGRKCVVEHGPGTWEPIVPADEFRALRALLCHESRTKHRGETGRKHLLSHVIRCGRCGQWLRAGSTTTRAGVRYAMYQCPDCRLGVDYGVAEDVVVRAVAGRLVVPSAGILALTEGERTAVRQVHRRLAQITADEVLIETSKVSAASKVRQLETLQEEREQLHGVLTRASQRRALASLLEEGSLYPATFSAAVEARVEAARRFALLDLDRKREVIRALLRVVVEPSPKGVRPTKATARRRVRVTWLDPRTGAPEEEDDCMV